MTFNRLTFIFILITVSYNSFCQTDEEIYSKIDSIISELTLYEKTQLIHGVEKFKSGSVERLGIKGLNFSDGHNGIREEMSKHTWDPAGRTNDSSTYLPTGIALAATWNPTLAYEYGNVLGQEALYRGKDIVLGPGVNIQRLAINGRTYEYFGEDPFLASKMAVNYIKGVQKNGVGACIKHAVANNNEKHRHEIDVHIDERTLHEIYLPVFKNAIKEAEVLCVMCGFNKFRNDFCCENKYVLNDIIKDEFGFKGIVLSDWAAIFNTQKAALAGLDIEIGTYKPYDEYYFANPLIEKVENEKIDERIIDDKVRRVLYTMFKTNKFGKKQKGAFNTKEHQQLAREVASESIVLLQNKELLPLDIKEIKSIAVLGDNATRKHAYGGYSAEIKAKYEITPLQGLKNKLAGRVEIKSSIGYLNNSDHDYMIRFAKPFKPAYRDSLLQAAVKIAKEVDAVIIFGGWNKDFDTESMDVDNLRLPYNQVELINAVSEVNNNVVVYIIGGIPTETRHFDENIDAMVLGWYGGMEGGNVYADMLFGDINPSGKLPYTMAQYMADFPPNLMQNYSYSDKKLEYSEGVFVGYRYFSTHNIKPRFSFGYGLSYTNFTFSDLHTSTFNMNDTDTITVSIEVKNTGGVDGAEVCQLYISKPDSKIERPIIELKAFDKTFLTPNESKVLNFEITKQILSYYSIDSQSWEAESGEYIIYIGNSSDNLLLKTKIHLNQIK